MRLTMTILSLPLFFGCATGSPHLSPSQQAAQDQYKLQLNEWRNQQEQYRLDDERRRANEDYYRMFDRELRLEEVRQKEETKREAIRQNSSPLRIPHAKENDKSELREKCLEGFECSSGDCKYPPDDLCMAAFKEATGGGAEHGMPNSGSHVYLVGATVENFFYNSAGSTGSDRSNRSRIISAPRGKMKQQVPIQPPAAPTMPKSNSEVWGEVVTSIWRDTLGAARSIAPWSFGADVLKTLATSPNNYVAVGDDLTSGGDNNTSRGDYVSKPVTFAPGGE